MSRITINMIADRAGVSRGTVDRVLHDRPNVKPEVRRHVLETAKMLGYKPLMPAGKKAGRTIGVLLPGNGWFEPHTKREWLNGLDAARKIVEPLGYHVTFVECETDLPGEAAEQIDRMRKEGLDALALTAMNSEIIRNKIAELSRAGIPVVTYNSDILDSSRLCFVGQDPYKSGRVAADMVVKCLTPKDRVLVVAGNLEFDGHRKRVSGFLDKISECGIDRAQVVVEESHNDYLLTYNKVTEGMHSIPELRAVYMANESVAGCVDAVSRENRKSGLMIVAHDLTEMTKKMLTSGSVDFIVEQNIYWQGYQPVLILKSVLEMPDLPAEAAAFTDMSVVNAECVI